MKIGLFMAPQWAPDANIDNGLAEVSALVRAARSNGFSSLLVGQHMVLAPIRMFQPIPLLGYLAREAEGMLVGASRSDSIERKTVAACSFTS